MAAPRLGATGKAHKRWIVAVPTRMTGAFCADHGMLTYAKGAATSAPATGHDAIHSI